MKVLSAVVTAIIGLAIFAFGAYFLALEMKTPPTHTVHIAIFSGLAFVGALIIRPDPIFVVLKKLSVVVYPYVPVLGGRRAGDPPKDTGEHPGAG